MTYDEDDIDAVIALVERSGITAEIDGWLQQRAGKTCAVTVKALLVGLLLASSVGHGHAGRLDRVAAIMRTWRPNVWRRCEVKHPDQFRRPKTKTAKADKDRAKRAEYMRLWRTWKNLSTWLDTCAPNGTPNKVRFSDALILASLPDHVLAYDSAVVDAAGVVVRETYITAAQAKKLQRDETHRVRKNANGYSKVIFGWQVTALSPIDPTGNDPHTWIGGINIATGSSSEVTDVVPLIERFGDRHGGVLDLIMGDRGYTHRQKFHHALRRYHADPVMDLDENQKAVARMPNGALNVFGTAGGVPSVV